MLKSVSSLLVLAVCCGLQPHFVLGQTRHFQINYGGTIREIKPDEKIDVWFPIPSSNDHQHVKIKRVDVAAPLEFNEDPDYGNRMGYFRVPVGQSEFSFQLSYRVVRSEVNTEAQPNTLTDDQRGKFLKKNRLVPIEGRPIELLRDVEMPPEVLGKGQVMYDIVEQYMKYDKSKPGYGNGDVLWACDSRTGNCTDFHSLFISLARSQNIPARFEIGFSIPQDESGQLAGYHCWAWFYDDSRGWVPVDISEADKHPDMKKYYFGNLTADRIAFSTGRDIELVPKARAGPLNYFVYPHVEVNGETMSRDRLEPRFSYQSHNQ